MRSPQARTVVSTWAGVVPRSKSYTLTNTTSKPRPGRTSRRASASLRSAMRFSTRRAKSCFGLRCKTATWWPAFRNSSTSSFPMKRVPPITKTFIEAPKALRRGGGGSDFIPRRAQPLSGYSQTIQPLIVIFQAQMRDQVLTTHPTQGILQLHKLDEDVVLGVNIGSMHGPLEIE